MLQINIVLLFCWKFFPNSPRPHCLLYFEVTWHLTIKLFPYKIIAKSMTSGGNSALLPAIRGWILRMTVSKFKKRKGKSLPSFTSSTKREIYPSTTRTSSAISMFSEWYIRSWYHHFFLTIEFLMRSSDFIIVLAWTEPHDPVRRITLSIQEVFEETF